MAQPSMKVRLLATVALVLVAVLLCWMLIRRAESRPWTRDGQVRADIVLLASQVSGRIVAVHVRDNQEVKAGELLLEIDPDSYKIAVQEAEVGLDQARQQVTALEAAVEAAKAGVDVAKAGVAAAQGQIRSAEAVVTAARHKLAMTDAGIAEAEAGIAQSQASLDEAERESARADQLAKSGAGSVASAERNQASTLSRKASLDRSRAALEQSKASRAAAEAAVTEAEASLGIARTGLIKADAGVASALAAQRQAEANLGVPGEENVNVRRAKVSLANARLNLERTRIVAPADGWITNLFIEPGNFAGPGAALITFVVRESIHVSGFFKETQLRHIKIGARAVITPMADSSRKLEGVVHSIGWAINPPSVAQLEGAQAMVPQVQPTFEWIRLAQRVPVRIELRSPPADLHLISGMTVSVAIDPGD